MTPLIELRGITLRYADTSRPVLDHVDLAIDPGELVVLAGPTGVGKSTLLGVVAGLVPTFTGGALTGDVLLDGASIIDLPASPTNQTSAQIDFSDTDPSATFACKLDTGSFATCTSPWTASGLSAATHTLLIRATDAAGNTSGNATASWTINPAALEPPTVNLGPSDPSGDLTPDFDFDTSATTPDSFSWSVVDGAFSRSGSATTAS